jgi:signal peptide peptidase SppA
MRYELISRWVMNTPWAILPEKLAAIMGLLAIRADGERLSPEEIAAATGGRRNGGPTQNGAIAVLPLYGTIAHRADMLMESSGGTSTERFSQALRTVLADSTVGAIVLDVDSPGGAVDGVPELASEIMRARAVKPVVAVANTLAASAAYWIGSAATELYVSPSGEVGSVGVWAAHQDLSAFYEKEGVRTTLITAGKYKAETNPYQPLSADARGFLQSRVDEFYGMFVAAVAKQRGTSSEAVRGGFGEGRVVGAKAAVNAGMADAVGTLDDAIARAASLARLASREAARNAKADADVRAILAGV